MPRNWTDDERAEIQTLSDEGLSLKEIGARFSVSDDTIRGVLRRKRGAEIEPPRQPIACVRYTKNSIGKCQSGAHRVPLGLLRKIPPLKRPIAAGRRLNYDRGPIKHDCRIAALFRTVRCRNVRPDQ